MKTREQAIEDLRRHVAEQGAILDTLTPEQAAARVFRPGGPTPEDLAAEFARTRYRGKSPRPDAIEPACADPAISTERR